MKVLIAFVALLSAACGPSVPSDPKLAGKAYFTQAGCASCHRVGGEGSAVGPDLTLVGFRHSEEWLNRFIKDPQAWKKDTLMPNKRMSDEAVRAISSYLAEQKGQAWTAGKPWDSAKAEEKGRVIYARAGCVGCHGVGGAGGYPNNNVKGGLIPRLNAAWETYTKPELVAKIKKGVPMSEKADPKGESPLIRMPTWSEKLSDDEIGAVADYLMTLRPGKGESSDSSF
ncbi:MAG: cytochrome c [Elusimicrobiota bacterium]|nr:MAG: cytochrome c [Elusimicrobiota bacterium]